MHENNTNSGNNSEDEPEENPAVILFTAGKSFNIVFKIEHLILIENKTWIIFECSCCTCIKHAPWRLDDFVTD